MSSEPVNQQTLDCRQLISKFMSRHRKAAVQKSSVYRMTCKRTFKTHGNFFERLPPEIILKILSYLDASSVFCINFVNKHLHELSNNNAMWYQLYVHERTKKKNVNKKTVVLRGPNTVSVQEKPKGYWRNMLFKEMSGSNVNKCRKKLQRIDPYSGMPCYTEEVLRSLCVTWEITVTDGRGRQSTFEQSHASFSSTAVFVFWGAANWPPLNQLTSLELCGVLRVPLHCPAAYRPGWKSVMSKMVLKGENKELCGSDKLVKLMYIGHGVTLGFWQDGLEIAFVMVNLHTHRLVERSLHLSVCPCTAAEVSALFDDVDPEYGLHGYSAYIELHNTERVIMSNRVSQLFGRRDQISDGYLPLECIRQGNRCLDTHLVSDVRLPWRTEALHGNIKDCCMMNLTVWDEAQQPFWCVSAPVVLTKADQEDVLYDADGQSFSILYQDSEGRVRIRLKHMEYEDKYIVFNLVIYISITKVNKHFGRDY